MVQNVFVRILLGATVHLYTIHQGVQRCGYRKRLQPQRYRVRFPSNIWYSPSVKKAKEIGLQSNLGKDANFSK
jgi:hypothetical protein